MELEKDLTKRHQGLRQSEIDKLINLETNKINNVGEWRGQNNIGKILMICRDCIIERIEPSIDYNLLKRSNIYLLGKLSTFK